MGETLSNQINVKHTKEQPPWFCLSDHKEESVNRRPRVSCPDVEKIFRLDPPEPTHRPPEKMSSNTHYDRAAANFTNRFKMDNDWMQPHHSISNPNHILELTDFLPSFAASLLPCFAKIISRDPQSSFEQLQFEVIAAIQPVDSHLIIKNDATFPMNICTMPITLSNEKRSSTSVQTAKEKYGHAMMSIISPRALLCRSKRR